MRRTALALATVLGILTASAALAQPASKPSQPVVLTPDAEDAFSTLLEDLRLFRDRVTLLGYEFNAISGAHCFSFATPNPYSGRPQRGQAGVRPDGTVVPGGSLCTQYEANRAPPPREPELPMTAWRSVEEALAQCSDRSAVLPPSRENDDEGIAPQRHIKTATSGQVGPLHWRICRGWSGPVSTGTRVSAMVFFEGNRGPPVLTRSVEFGNVGVPVETEGRIVVPITGTGSWPVPLDFVVYRQGLEWAARPEGHLNEGLRQQLRSIDSGSIARVAAQVTFSPETRSFSAQILRPGEGHCCPTGGQARGQLAWEGTELKLQRVVVARIGVPTRRYDLRAGRWTEMPLGDEWTLEEHLSACWRGQAPRDIDNRFAVRARISPDGRIESLEHDRARLAETRFPRVDRVPAEAREARTFSYIQGVLARCPIPKEYAGLVNGRVQEGILRGPVAR